MSKINRISPQMAVKVQRKFKYGLYESTTAYMDPEISVRGGGCPGSDHLTSSSSLFSNKVYVFEE